MSPLLALCPRRALLLIAIRTEPGKWTTSRAWDVNRTNGAPNRRTARRDLDALHRAGLLTQDDDQHRSYQLTTKGSAS